MAGSRTARRAGKREADIAADEAHLNSSGALRVRASLVEARQSALGSVRSNEVWMDGGVAGRISAENAKISGFAGLVTGDTVGMAKTTAAVVIGSDIRAEKIKGLVVFGNHVSGNVHTVFDLRHALMAGLLGGLVAGMLLSLTRGLIRSE